MSDRPYRVQNRTAATIIGKVQNFFDNHEERIYKRSNTLVRHSETTSTQESRILRSSDCLSGTGHRCERDNIYPGQRGIPENTPGRQSGRAGLYLPRYGRHLLPGLPRLLQGE